MTPRILSRPDHVLSRKSVDSDALKVLYRLKNQGYKAYLVGGSVRDLLLGRAPKDFDIGTSAHPHQVKRLFRNAFVVGRRFRLCHVRFGNKVIEVSTFRRQAESEGSDRLIRRDNTFGTPEQDAFRRDFTVNALFYDIATFSVIDFVGGLEDLERGVIRTIGDPEVRFQEDPVRMLRAIALAERLRFSIDRDTLEAIRLQHGEIVKSSPARLLEELYKILRQGASRATFKRLHDIGLLKYLLPEADASLRTGNDELLQSLGRLDDFRNSGRATLEELTNPILLGTIVVPLDVQARRGATMRRSTTAANPIAHDKPTRSRSRKDDVPRELALMGIAEKAIEPMRSLKLPSLPFARRDFDRLRLIVAAQQRLADTDRPHHVQKALVSRGYFKEALRWIEIHDAKGFEIFDYWRGLMERRREDRAVEEPRVAPLSPAGRRRRRRRRRSRRNARSTIRRTSAPTSAVVEGGDG